MFITKRALSRRTVLRGMGAAVALPLLDAMVPAQTLLAPTDRGRAEEPLHRHRDGARQRRQHRSTASTSTYWSPATDGRDFEFTHDPEAARAVPRLPHGGHADRSARAPSRVGAEEEGADHFRSSAVFLTAAHPKQTEGSDVRNGTSIDQIYAQQFGQDTPLPSIQLCIENVDPVRHLRLQLRCVYMDTISWASPTTPLPMTHRSAAWRSRTCSATAARRPTGPRADGVNRSILDGITRDIGRLQRNLGRERPRPAERLPREHPRDRAAHPEDRAAQRHGAERELPAAPIGVPDSWEEHVKLMFDLQVLAFAADVTRVSTFKLSRDTSNRVFAESGIKTPFHSMSHHGRCASRRSRTTPRSTATT